jgi:hypothetical protein
MQNITAKATNTPNAPSALYAMGLCVLMGILGRVLPHFPNVTPMTSISLFNGTKLNRAMALLTTAIALLVSDILLAYFYGYPIFSLWSIFTYSGFFFITLCGKRMGKVTIVTAMNNGDGTSRGNNGSAHWQSLPIWIASMSLGYWLWTNLGVWLTSGMYAKNAAGLLSCYIAALPFLRTALIGDLIWGAVIFGAFSLLTKSKHFRYQPT